jgi:hypothetical protein
MAIKKLSCGKKYRVTACARSKNKRTRHQKKRIVRTLKEAIEAEKKLRGEAVRAANEEDLEYQRRSEYNREYKRSLSGKAARMWNDLNKRASKYISYTEIEIRMTRQQFFEFVLNDPNYHQYHQEWKLDGYSVRASPSVDRIDPYGHYEISNIQIVPMHINAKRPKRKPKKRSN